MPQIDRYILSQFLTLFGFFALVLVSVYWINRAVSLFEQAADGMSTVALFAVMMRMCRPEHEGADFTLQASAQVLLAGLIGASSGFLARLVGYEVVFIGAAILGGMMLILVARYFAGERRVV